MSAEFPFHLDKAIQAAGVLARQSRAHQLPYFRAIKLLYIADRESLKETGRPITGDRAYAMRQGPVLGHIYDFIRGRQASTEWSDIFRTDGYLLTMLKDPGDGSLSNYEIEKLQEVSAGYQQMDHWTIRDLTHVFPEWLKYEPRQSSVRITLKDILEALEMSPDNIDRILKEAAYFSRVEAVLCVNYEFDTD